MKKYALYHCDEERLIGTRVFDSYEEAEFAADSRVETIIISFVVPEQDME